MKNRIVAAVSTATGRDNAKAAGMSEADGFDELPPAFRGAVGWKEKLWVLMLDAARGRREPLEKFIRDLRTTMNFKPSSRTPKEPIFNASYRLQHAAEQARRLQRVMRERHNKKLPARPAAEIVATWSVASDRDRRTKLGQRPRSERQRSRDTEKFAEQIHTELRRSANKEKRSKNSRS